MVVIVVVNNINTTDRGNILQLWIIIKVVNIIVNMMFMMSPGSELWLVGEHMW